MSAPTIQASETLNFPGSSTTSHTVNKPTGTSEGDLLLVHIAVNENDTLTGNITNLGDFGFNFFIQSPIKTTSETVSTTRITYVGWKIATASEPSSYTYTTAGSRRAAIVLTRVTGVDTNCPLGMVRLSRVDTDGSPSGADFDHTAPALPITGDSVVFRVLTAYDDGITFSKPSDVTELIDTDTSSYDDINFIVAHDTSSHSDGSTAPNRTWTQTSPTNYVDGAILWSYQIFGVGQSGRTSSTPVYKSVTDFFKNSSTGSTDEIAKPDGTVEGDLILFAGLCVSNGYDGPSNEKSIFIEEDEGFTPLISGVFPTDSQMINLSYKIATASEPSTYTVNRPSETVFGAFARFSNVRSVNPILIGSGTLFGDGTPAAGSSGTFPALNSVPDNSLMVRGLFYSEEASSKIYSNFVLPFAGNSPAIVDTNESVMSSGSPVIYSRATTNGTDGSLHLHVESTSSASPNNSEYFLESTVGDSSQEDLVLFSVALVPEAGGGGGGGESSSTHIQRTLLGVG